MLTTIASITKGPGEQINVSLLELTRRGKKFVTIQGERKHGDTWRPVRGAVVVPLALVPQMIAALQEAVKGVERA